MLNLKQFPSCRTMCITDWLLGKKERNRQTGMSLFIHPSWGPADAFTAPALGWRCGRQVGPHSCWEGWRLTWPCWARGQGKLQGRCFAASEAALDRWRAESLHAPLVALQLGWLGVTGAKPAPELPLQLDDALLSPPSLPFFSPPSFLPPSSSPPHSLPNSFPGITFQINLKKVSYSGRSTLKEVFPRISCLKTQQRRFSC